MENKVGLCDEDIILVERKEPFDRRKGGAHKFGP